MAGGQLGDKLVEELRDCGHSCGVAELKELLKVADT
jgi:hypothetical protein